MHSRETLDRYKSDVSLVGVAWHANDAVLMTRDGELALWRDVVPQHLPSPVKPDVKATVFDNDAAKIAQLMAASGTKHTRATDSDGDDDGVTNNKNNGDDELDDAAMLKAADEADAAHEASIATTTTTTTRATKLGGTATTSSATSRLRKRATGDDDDDDKTSVQAAAVTVVQQHRPIMPNASPASRKRRILGNMSCHIVMCLLNFIVLSNTATTSLMFSLDIGWHGVVARREHARLCRD